MQQSSGFFDWLTRYGERDPEFLIGILVFVVLCVLATAVLITVLWIRHRERLAMIEKGILPEKAKVSA
jgi:hypothetical protein